MTTIIWLILIPIGLACLIWGIRNEKKKEMKVHDIIDKYKSDTELDCRSKNLTVLDVGKNTYLQMLAPCRTELL